MFICALQNFISSSYSSSSRCCFLFLDDVFDVVFVFVFFVVFCVVEDDGVPRLYPLSWFSLIGAAGEVLNGHSMIYLSLLRL